MTIDSSREFRPHQLLRSGHAQTLAGVWLPWRRVPYRAVPHRIRLADGDVLVVHDDRPPGWKPGQRIVLLMHGLSGSHQSGYMVRISTRLYEQGVRTFRLDLRGAGAGAGLARRSYNAGCSADALQSVEFLESICPGSPICLVGFSLSGNVILKLLGESPERLPASVNRAIALNPPIDLQACSQELSRFSNRIYDRHFVKSLHNSVQVRREIVPNAAIPEAYRRPRSLYEFDDRYTARVSGFANAAEYYSRCSAAQFLDGIRVPTLILTARDDPLVPVATFEQIRLPESVRLHISSCGGHLGYIAARGTDPDRRWMDWRVIEWVHPRGDQIG